MRDRNDTLVVFTSESLGSLLGEGGSQAWKLNPLRAERCTWLLCARNRFHGDRGRQSGAEPHGTAFLLGRISMIGHPTQPGNAGRWKIAFGAFAHIHHPDLWDGGQNPVRYANLARFGIDTAQLVFRPVRLWSGWAGMPGPTGYRAARQDSLAGRAGIAAEGSRG